MKNFFSKKHITSMLGGFFAIVFGLIAIFFPSITLTTLAQLFAVAVFIGGVFSIISSLKSRYQNINWKLNLFEGIIGVLLGIMILINHEYLSKIFAFIIGAWAILVGLIFAIVKFKRILPRFERDTMLIAGVFSIIFGFTIILNPFEGSKAVIILIGLYSIAYGIFSLIKN